MGRGVFRRGRAAVIFRNVEISRFRNIEKSRDEAAAGNGGEKRRGGETSR
jgi:hypothetical protein